MGFSVVPVVRARDDGFTMIELMVMVLIFGIVSTSFYAVLFAMNRGSSRARSVAAVSEEARLGFNRMVRDTREGQEITAATPNSFTVRVDFENDAVGPQLLTFEKSGSSILLNGERLMEQVDCIRVSGTCAQPVFRYTSNRLEYDWNADGITTWQELDQSADPSRGVIGIGNNDGVLNVELASISDVTFALRVTNGDTSSRLIAQAQLRNRR
jgi:prepilin-type N-terminal cleavage/methylation domain-containing protein